MPDGLDSAGVYAVTTSPESHVPAGMPATLANRTIAGGLTLRPMTNARSCRAVIDGLAVSRRDRSLHAVFGRFRAIGIVGRDDAVDQIADDRLSDAVVALHQPLPFTRVIMPPRSRGP